jgi:hypothetical protein
MRPVSPICMFRSPDEQTMRMADLLWMVAGVSHSGIAVGAGFLA